MPDSVWVPVNGRKDGPTPIPAWSAQQKSSNTTKSAITAACSG